MDHVCEGEGCGVDDARGNDVRVKGDRKEFGYGDAERKSCNM